LTIIAIHAIIIDIESKQLANTATFKEEQKMTKRMEQTQNAKMVQLALFREYGFQPCLKDIKILNTRDFDEFPGHVEALYTVVKGHFYNVFFDVTGEATVYKY
jgi:hypothetical protein